MAEQVGAYNGCQHPCRQPLTDQLSKKSIDVYCGDYLFLKIFSNMRNKAQPKTKGKSKSKKLLY